jgi:hypothetical protein
MKSESVLRAACSLVSEAEARVLYEALGQFVENLQNAVEVDEVSGDVDMKESPVVAKLKTAEDLLEKMDSAIAALAG